MANSPTQRSLADLKARGYEVAVVERWNAFAKIRQDLFGWMDLLAFHVEEKTTVGIQTTTRDNMLSRKEKVLTNDLAYLWLAAGNRILIHGWAKRKERGKARIHYELVEMEIKANDFPTGRWGDS